MAKAVSTHPSTRSYQTLPRSNSTPPPSFADRTFSKPPITRRAFSDFPTLSFALDEWDDNDEDEPFRMDDEVEDVVESEAAEHPAAAASSLSPKRNIEFETLIMQFSNGFVKSNKRHDHSSNSSSPSPRRPTSALGLYISSTASSRRPSPPSPLSSTWPEDLARSPSYVSLRSREAGGGKRRRSSSSGMTLKMLPGGKAKGTANRGVSTQEGSVSLPDDSPLREHSYWATPTPPSSPAAPSCPPISPSSAAKSLADINAHHRRHSTPLEHLITSTLPPSTIESPTTVTPMDETPELRAYLNGGRRSSIPRYIEPSDEKQRGRSSSISQFASDKFSTLRSSISMLGVRRATLAPPIPWTHVVSIRVSFRAGEPASSSANAFLLGLRSLERGGSRTWDPRMPLPPTRSPDATTSPLPSPSAFTPLVPLTAVEKWPTLVVADGDPTVSVTYRDGSTRTVPTENVSPLEIMRAVLAPKQTL